tara:strand:- start:2522 stop:3382 length:861 start_codon:yes stop_codon:yes gene_type:complete
MYKARKIIASVTTIPSRLAKADESISSIMRQHVSPDEIVLCLPKESLREPSEGDPYELPDTIKNLQKSGRLTIIRTENDYGPATKLLGVLEREIEKDYTLDNEPLIITFDDDKFYEPEAISQMLNPYLIESGCVVCRKGSNFYVVDKSHPLYNEQSEGLIEKQRQCFDLKSPMRVDIVFGGGMVMYRPSFFDEDVFEYEESHEDFPADRAFFVDDLFISGYLARRGVNKVVVNTPKSNQQQKMPNGIIDMNTDNKDINPISLLTRRHKSISHDTIEFFKDDFVSKI